MFNEDCLITMSRMEDKSVDLILTDPPYGMSYERHIQDKKHKKIDNDDNLDWLPNFMCELKRVSNKNSHIYMFCSWHNIDIFKQEFSKNFHLKNVLIWNKGGGGMGDLRTDFGGVYEMILFGTKLCDIENQRGLNGSRDTNIINGRKSGNEFHPTQKPTDLIEYLLRKSMKDGDIVYDPFMGSGTTAIACKSLGLDYIGSELDEDYYKIIQKRLSKVQASLF